VRLRIIFVFLQERNKEALIDKVVGYSAQKLCGRIVHGRGEDG